MKRMVALGDIHGRDDWKHLTIDMESIDKFIVVGDYFDSLHIGYHRQKWNFMDLIALKEAYPDKVVLLFGNHDYHYTNGCPDSPYSGFQRVHGGDIRAMIEDALKRDLLQMAFTMDNILFTHAGVSKTWCHANRIDTEDADIAGRLNDLLKYKPNSFYFNRGANDSDYGDDITQSPIWIRPTSLLKDKLKGYRQVVGHTHQWNIITGNGETQDDIVFIDVLDREKPGREYLEIIDGQFKARKIYE